ncbi:hypothetical protein CDAR_270881 [Caerostris darwini]|uniref:Uncharacterized protein n=1 Tax=Caerostris darwini TaxID=1538125 RepID=A0AAV4TD12_9ARAC|nr:hypothetical protein CDAR_270881 [Caerostris darwini]
MNESRKKLGEMVSCLGPCPITNSLYPGNALRNNLNRNSTHINSKDYANSVKNVDSKFSDKKTSKVNSKSRENANCDDVNNELFDGFKYANKKQTSKIILNLIITMKY